MFGEGVLCTLNVWGGGVLCTLNAWGGGGVMYP